METGPSLSLLKKIRKLEPWLLSSLASDKVCSSIHSLVSPHTRKVCDMPKCTGSHQAEAREKSRRAPSEKAPLEALL